MVRQRGADARETLPNHADGKRDPRPIRQPERCPSSTSCLMTGYARPAGLSRT